MADYFCVSVAFLDPVPAFHGCRDADEPEWPPSPLRLFQALVAAAASRWHGQSFETEARPALVWLERRPRGKEPLILAPRVYSGIPYRIAVPNNDMNVPASSWTKGQEPKKPHRPQDLRPLKTVRRNYLRTG